MNQSLAVLLVGLLLAHFTHFADSIFPFASAAQVGASEPSDDGKKVAGESNNPLSGTWYGQFETPFGLQTYQLHFSSKDTDEIDASAEVESRGESRKVEFVDVKKDGNSIEFAEVVQFGEREFRIEYLGTPDGANLKLRRSFGRGRAQEAIATRNKPKAPPRPRLPIVEIEINQTIKDAAGDAFLIGMAGDLPSRYSEQEVGLAAEHFTAVTPENCMKPERVHPTDERWNFGPSDALVNWAEKNGMTIHGHTLVWHSQTPDWFYDGDADTVRKRMKNHIETLAGRYRGRLQSWDVVNEAINDGGSDETAMTENLRESGWLQALGPEFIATAFRYARETDPTAVLFYNDYNIESGYKHASSMVLLKRLLADGVPIDGVGIQGHWRSGRVPFADIDKAISDYAALGLKVAITELDVTIRGDSGGRLGQRRFRRPGSASVEDLNAQAEDYAKLFAIFKKHEDAIERVTFWGLNDRRTWRRGQQPLPFDEENNPKPAYASIVDALASDNTDDGTP